MIPTDKRRVAGQGAGERPAIRVSFPEQWYTTKPLIIGPGSHFRVRSFKVTNTGGPEYRRWERGIERALDDMEKERYVSHQYDVRLRIEKIAYWYKKLKGITEKDTLLAGGKNI